MEIVLEIPDEKAKELNLTDERISFEELERKLDGQRLADALRKANESAKKYGIDKWTTEDINQVIKEAREEYAKEKGHC